MTSEVESSYSEDEESQHSFSNESNIPSVLGKRPFNQPQKNRDKSPKQNKGRSIHLLVHRVFITYFARYLKRKGVFKKSKFLLFNPDLNENTFDKFERNIEINEKLDELKSKHGENWLLKETSVQWLTNGSFICLEQIPESLMEKYSEDPYRYRAKNSKRPSQGSKYKLIIFR